MTTRQLARFVLALLVTSVALTASLAFADGPSTSPVVVIHEGFEPGDPSIQVAATPVSSLNPTRTAYWGVDGHIAASGTHSLWCAGSLYPSGSQEATLWPHYPFFTSGDATLTISETTNFYSSALSFAYIEPSLAIGDDNASNFLYPNRPFSDSLRPTSTWKTLSFDWSVSRAQSWVQFHFAQQGLTSENATDTKAQGTSIDDIVVSGWKYGPVRSLSVANVGTSLTPTAQLTWSKPASSTTDASDDGRDMSYRVWRLDTGDPTGTWTELTSGSRVDEPTRQLQDASVLANHVYEYAVQAWDPSNGTSAWGVVQYAGFSTLADLVTTSTDGFKKTSATTLSVPTGTDVVLKTQVVSHATGNPIHGLASDAFSVRSSASADMSGASSATVTDFVEDTATPGTYYLTVQAASPSSLYYRVDFDGLTDGYHASQGSPVLNLVATGSSTLLTTGKSITIGYGQTAHVVGTLSTSQGLAAGEAAHIQLQHLVGGVWTTVAATINDLGGGVYSANTAAIYAKDTYRLHFAGDGVYDPSADSGTVVALPTASLSTPSSAPSVKHNVTLKVTGYLKPRHASGAKSVLIKAYRYQSGKWVLRQTFSATNSNYSTYTKYSASIKLKYAGKWRLYAYHSDADHAPTTSGYKSVTAK